MLIGETPRDLCFRLAPRVLYREILQIFLTIFFAVIISLKTPHPDKHDNCYKCGMNYIAKEQNTQQHFVRDTPSFPGSSRFSRWRLIVDLEKNDCKAGSTAKGQIYWLIFRLAELVFLRSGIHGPQEESVDLQT